MPSLTDDHVATLLKSEAAQRNETYNLIGMRAYTSRTPGAPLPKPNTRFLSNLLKETEGHNAALLAKERREARARQESLKRAWDGREEGEGRGEGRERKRRRDRSRDGERGRDEKGHRGERKRRRSGQRRGDGSEDDERRRKRREKRRRGRSRDPESSKSHRDSYKSRHRRSRSRSPRKDIKPPRDDPKRITTPAKHGKPPKADASDSDPLDDIIGPRPPPQPAKKGRGAFSHSTSNIDAHFKSSYDPSLDVQPNSGAEDDWEQALEAMRDREKWRQQGAERLRAAGFSDDQVKKWEKTKVSARGEIEVEGDISDVKWARKGEGREWDRGKVVDAEDGSVVVESSWGRLKGS